MPKFFVEKKHIQENCILLSKEDSKHVKTVLRGKIGDELTVCDGEGSDYHCSISALEELVAVHIRTKTLCEAEPRRKITLYQGLPKADKMEFIIQKCIELGVERIVAVSTERSIVKLDKKEEKKIERWQKIAEAAAKQSGRGKIPEIGESVLNFMEALQEAKDLDGAVIPYEKECERGLKAFAEGFHGESIGIFIGPEGGFSGKEIHLALDSEVLPVTLGKRILRTETAGMTTIAILLHELG